MKLATLCYLRRDGSTLMIHRNKRPDDYHFGKWNGLGGKFSPGESPEDCARREIREESGLDAGRLEFKGIITFTLFDGKDDWYVFLFNAYDPSGELTHPEEGTLEWIPDERIQSLNLWPGDTIFLPWMREKRFFSARFDYENGEFRKYSVEFYD